jgi:hypothetical protein
MLFTPQLARAKRGGLAEYGTLTSSYVMAFDQKWLRSKPNDEELLGTGDIQSLADLGNSFAVIREMRAIPFATDDVIRLLIATVAPSSVVADNHATRKVGHPGYQDHLLRLPTGWGFGDVITNLTDS